MKKYQLGVRKDQVWSVSFVFGAVLVSSFMFFISDATAAPVNLIANPSFVTPSPANPNLPQGWLPDRYWGVNTAIFTYPVPGASDATAAKVEISLYTSGDAKWDFDEVSVTAGRTYTYTDLYQSDVPTHLIVEMWDTSGGTHFSHYTALPASPSSWGSASVTFTVPDGMVMAKVMHLLSSIGYLTIDDTSLSEEVPPVGDGSNLIPNASFASGSPNAPQSWMSNAWGTNTATFVYPVVGVSDATAAKVQITSYSSGDAKWMHASVPVIAGHTYAYSDRYQSDAPSVLIVERAHTNGAMSYTDYVALPASSSSWGAASDTFTIPSGVSSVRVFHILPSVGFLTIDDVVLNDTAATGTPSTSATVKVVTDVINDNGGANTPGDFNITVSGASASPSFFAGSAAGIDVTVAAGGAYQVTTVPGLFYSVSYSPDCTGTLTGGNSVICTITLDDIAQSSPGTSPNLVKNSSLETPDTVDHNRPKYWNTGSWGTNTTIFSYTDATTSLNETVPELSSGGKSVTVQLTSHTNGDAKWMFDPVPVTSGRTYVYQDAYISDVPTELVVAYTHADGSVTYSGFVAVPASAPGTWKQTSGTFTVPSGVTSATVYHLIARVGSLTIDNASLTEVLPPVSFDQGFVTLSFDDGLLSTYTNGLPILNAANLKGSFYVITHTAGMAVVNPNLEIADTANASMPQGWLQSGSMNASFSYPVIGQSGKAAEVTSTEIDSNAAWHFAPVTVFSDQGYAFADAYQSTASSDILIQLTTASGTVKYINSAGEAVEDKVPARELASSGGAWVALPELHFYIPPEVTRVTVLHRLTGIGSLAIDTISLGAFPDFMTPANVLSMQGNGHEIGGHTQTHPDLTLLASNDQFDQINGGRQDLLNTGISPVLTFAYPYGVYNDAVVQTTQQAGYIGARSILPGFNGKNTDKYGLLAQSVNADTSLAQVQSWIDQARANRHWLVLVFHAIKNDLTNDPYGTTPGTLQGITTYLNGNSVPARTMAQGIGLMNP